MFPLNWNIPFIRKNGSRTTLGAITGDIAGIEGDVAELKNRLPLLIDNGLVPTNSSKTISIADSSSALYRLTLGSIGADGCGKIVIFGKHPSVANIKYATFDCVDVETSYVASISVSGKNLTITSSANSNCMYTLEQIKA